MARKGAEFGIKKKVIGKGQAKNDDAVPTKDKKAFRTTNPIDGPSHHLEDHQQAFVSPKRAAVRFHDDKTDEKLKLFREPKHDTSLTITYTKLKERSTRSQRQENRWNRIYSRTSRVDTRATTSVSPRLAQGARQDNEDEYEQEQEATPGAVQVAGMTSDNNPGQRRSSLLSRSKSSLFMSAHGMVTAEAVDGEVVCYAEDVELDNSARNTRLMVYCAVVGAMVVSVAVLLGVLLTRDTSPSDGDPRCKLEPGEVNVVVNCKCRNTTELYIESLSTEEISMHYELLETLSLHEMFSAYTDVEMSSCSQRNQAVLEMASFKRKGLNPEIAKAAKAELDFDGMLQMYGIFLFYIQMDGDIWENKENWLEGFNYCGWFGVTCSSALRIASLVLRSNGLAGTLPNEMHLFSNLIELDLSDNKGIYGPLPAEFMSKARRLRK
jgi:hypothetical protein